MRERERVSEFGGQSTAAGVVCLNWIEYNQCECVQILIRIKVGLGG